MSQVPDSSGPATYRIEFTRIGRHQGVPALEVPASCSQQELVDRIRRYAQPKLVSRSVEVWADLGAGVGFIQVGSHPAGSFTIRSRA